MGRELMRVPAGFDWPVGKIWPGKMLSVCGDMEYIDREASSEERCELCRKWDKLAGLELNVAECPDLPLSNPPKGEWYQVWETVSEGSPISPAFETPTELAGWLVEHAEECHTEATFEEWMAFINGPGWAPSGAIINGQYKNGVQAMKEMRGE